MEFDQKAQREYLENMYWDENKSLTQIAKELKIPYTTLWFIFHECRIKTRTRKKAVKLWWKGRLRK